MDLTIYRDYPDGLVALGNLVRENGETTFCYNRNTLPAPMLLPFRCLFLYEKNPFPKRNFCPTSKVFCPSEKHSRTCAAPWASLTAITSPCWVVAASIA